MSKFKTFAGALTLVLLASCGGNAQKAAPATSPVSLAVDTTAGPTTVAPTTLPAPTTPPTTATPTTTTMSLKDLEKTVRQAHDAYWVTLFGCISAPASCDPTLFTQPDSAARTNVTRSIAALIEKKWAIRQNDSDPAINVVDSVVLNGDGTTATLKVCSWDSAITLQPNAGPNGEDIIVDDTKNSSDLVVTMVQAKGRWFFSDAVRSGTVTEGVNTCVAH
jgi:hypothetical protein